MATDGAKLVNDRYGEPRPPFAQWLMAQRDRGDWIDDIAAAARADRNFPRAGDVDAVKKRLHQVGADGDAFAAVDDAELHYLSY